jgi:56kDa selenium binding protein (SBP56)
VDDRWLYVSCWGTGELKQYDVADPFHPRETGSVKLGGIVGRRPHPAAPQVPLGGGPQMVEISRDGRRVYVTNSLSGVWDDSFYPDGVGAWAARLDADPDRGGLAADPRLFPNGNASGGCGCTRPACRAGMPPATPTATPADMHPLAHHAGEQALAPLLLASGGHTLLVAIGRARLDAARARLARTRRRGAS